MPIQCEIGHTLRRGGGRIVHPYAAWRAACLAALAVVVAALAACGDASGPVDALDLSEPWTYVGPSAVGLDSARLETAAAQAAAIPRFHALLVARHGRLVLERYFAGVDQQTLNDVRSVTKSVVSTLAGIAHQRGLLPNLDTTIAAYLGADYRLDAADSAVTVRDLLTMSSGYSWTETTAEYNRWISSAGDHVQFVLDLPVANLPGTTFAYNTGAVHLLGVLLEHATGLSLPAFAERYLFTPLGIHDVEWEPLDPGTVNGGAGIDLRAQDLLRLGQLFLQEGRSGTHQIVPADWVTLATRPYYTWRWGVGPLSTVTYGYLWWVSTTSIDAAYFAWGYGGQFIYVVPSQDLVVVATTDWTGIGDAAAVNALESAVLDVIVNGVVPATH
jgi:CubicO group peptidase (beta-lactamase class C family)